MSGWDRPFRIASAIGAISSVVASGDPPGAPEAFICNGVSMCCHMTATMLQAWDKCPGFGKNYFIVISMFGLAFSENNFFVTDPDMHHSVARSSGMIHLFNAIKGVRPLPA